MIRNRSIPALSARWKRQACPIQTGRRPVSISYSPASAPDHVRPVRILNILLSTYEYAVRKNTELQEAHEQVTALNEELMATVDELQAANKNLSNENAERTRVEKALADANRQTQPHDEHHPSRHQ